MEITELLSVGWKYLRNSSNYLDLAMIVLTFIILYVPTDMLWNPEGFGSKDYEHDKHDETLPDDERKFNRGCEVKRAISAIIIVLVFFRYLGSVAQLPGFKEYNIYLIMFNKVMKSYMKVMVWFACYILAFGLGFYIMFHDDTTRKKDNTAANSESSSSRSSCKDESKESRFDHPFLALTKTWAMFVGEIDFGSLKIRGGDISTTMGYLYLLSFIFMIVIVVMNLLNGLAVSDIQKIVSESKIETETSLIQTIQYLEAVSMNGPLLINKWSQTRRPSQMLVFESFRLTHRPELPLRLTLPLEETTSDGQYKNNCWNSVKSCFSSVFSFLHYDSAENYGSDEFIGRARKILARLWKAKVQTRKQKNLALEIKKIEDKKWAANEDKSTETGKQAFDKKRFERLKDETLKDQIRNIEDILKKMASDSIVD
jgi:hypothetical protein